MGSAFPAISKSNHQSTSRTFKRLLRESAKYLIPPKLRPYLKDLGNRANRILHRADFLESGGKLRSILDEHPQRKGIVVLPPLVDWDWMKQRPHHLLAEFARAGYLTFFCSPKTHADSFHGFKKVADSLYLCSYPETLHANLSGPIVFATHPGHLEQVRSFENPRVIYDHLDDIRVHCHHNKINDLAIFQHEELLRIAEIVCATAERLHDRVLAVRPDAILCPNGVHYDHFACAGELPMPSDLLKIVSRGKPIIGYYGALAKWFDYDLVKWTGPSMSALRVRLDRPELRQIAE